MNTLWQDLSYSLRGFRQNPVFTMVALGSLALGIGANTAIFSLMDQVLLRSLPVKDPDRIVLFVQRGDRSGHVNSNYGIEYSFSHPLYRDFRDRAAAAGFSDVMTRNPQAFSASWKGQTERIYGDLVSGNYFEFLGVSPAIGRILTDEDDRKPGAHPVVMLSYGYWKRRFAGDPGVLNQVIRLNDHAMTVVGVAQPGFRGVGIGEAPDVFVPMMMRAQMSPGEDDLNDRHSMWLNIFARLKPEVSRTAAEAAANGVMRPLLAMEADQIRSMSAAARARYIQAHLSLKPGGRGITGAPPEFGIGIKLLMGMVGLLLLIACANVANLMIARATARQREIGIRLALGAGRLRIVRQLLVESVALALVGGLFGLLVAAWTGDALLKLLPTDPATRGLLSAPDARILAFAFALSVLTGVVFGLVPALQSTRGNDAATLRDQAANLMGGLHGARFRKALVTAQVALSLVLLVAAGLFAKSLYNVKNIDPGFHTDHLMSFTIQPSLNGYDANRTRALLSQLQENISRLPGIQAVSTAQEQLLIGDMSMTGVGVEGYSEKTDEDMSMDYDAVGPGFLATMGIPLLAGRDFSKADNASGPPVAVVNEEFVKRYLPGQAAIGHRIWLHDDKKRRMEIVGVVKDGKHWGLREGPKRFVYVASAQQSVSRMTFYARTRQEPAAVAAMLRREVQRLDANLPIYSVQTMDQQIDEAIFTDRIVAVLSVAFGALATLLAAIGLYGVMAYMVVRRTREIGVRMALGASQREVLGLVMREVALVMGFGIAIALACSYALGRVIGSQLYGVSGTDPAVIASATLGLAAVAALAGFIPASRAARVDPLVALRYE